MRWIESKIFLFVVLSATVAGPVPFAVDDSLRLPQTSFPVSYELTIATSVHDGSRNFTGAVEILIEVRQTTKVITLHNRGLEVEAVVLRDNANQVVQQSIRHEVEKQFLHIESVDDLPAGNRFTIEIIYNGLLSLKPLGLYRSSYRVGSELR